MRTAALLWNAGVRTKVVYAPTPNLEVLYARCAAQGVKWVVAIKVRLRWCWWWLGGWVGTVI